MPEVAAVLLPSENMKKITGSSVQDNVKGSIQLMQNYFGELGRLPPNDRNSILRAIIIGQEARVGAEMVFGQIQQETSRLGKPPLTENEFRKFQNNVNKIHSKTLGALVRLSPSFFSDQAYKLFEYSDAQSEPSMSELAVAFIRGARIARTIYERNTTENMKVGDFMGYCAFWANILTYEDIETIKPEGRAMRLLIAQLQYAALVYSLALKVMKENNLEYASQGKGFDVAIFYDDEPIIIDIKIPIQGEMTPAKASSLLNSMVASTDFPIAENIHISFKRGSGK